MLKHRKLKIPALILAAALLTGSAGAAAYAAGSKNAAPSDTQKTAEAVLQDVISTRNVGKEETVYVLANADGSAEKVIVSDWLKNPDGAASLTDQTTLQDIQNVRGEQSYTINADNMQIWDAQGSDIYYQGVTDRALPVDVSIRYQLDGKDISAEELAGKSGRVTMRFDYTNHESRTARIDGKDQTVYVPFVMITGMILDNDTFSNVAVSNGKLIEDGDRCIVMGFALPGMQESLDIARDTLELPESVEITADVKNFSLTTTVTLATNDIFNSLNLDDVDSLDQLTSSLEELQDAFRQLMDGSSQLYDGLSQLLDKSGELISGINQLYAGASALNGGAAQVSGGAKELEAGIASLNEGLRQLTSNSAALNGGAKQVFESLLAAANSQLAAAGLSVPQLTMDNYQNVLSGVLSSLDPDAVYQMAYNTAKAKVTEAVSAQRPTIRSAVETAVRNQVLEGVLSAAGYPMTAEQYAAAVAAGQIPEELQAQISAAVEAQMASDEIQASIESAVDAKVNELIEANMQSAEVQAQISAAVEQAKNGAGSIQNLLDQLNSYQTFYNGLLAYTGGVDSAYAGCSGQLQPGAAQLSEGAASLSQGAAQLYGGLGALKDGSGALKDGVQQLADGAMQLSDGMKEFNEQGVQKLVDALDGDLSGLISRLQAVSDASRSYQTFAGMPKDMDGSVKFIYRTESIGE